MPNPFDSFDSLSRTGEDPFAQFSGPPKEKSIFEKYMSGELSETAFAAYNELQNRGALDDPNIAMRIGIPTEREVRPGAQFVSDMARPLLSGAGATAGAMLGTPGAPGLGTLAGGGLGFAAGEELADQLDEWLGIRERQPLMVELQESAEDVLTGAAFEAGGQSLAPILGATFRAIKRMPNIPLTRAGAEKKAGEVIVANTVGGPLVAKNIDEARALEEAIPGLRFGRGQLTNDPSVIKFERSQARMPGDVAIQHAEQTALNTRALRAFVTKEKGAGTIEDVVGTLEKQREGLDTGIRTAQAGLEREAGALDTGIDPMDIGQSIRGAAREGESAARAASGELFEDVPQFGIDASKLGSRIDDLSKPYSKVEDLEKNIPSIFGRTKKLLDETNGVLTPDDLQGIRSEVSTDLRRVQGGAEVNARKAARLQSLRNEVDNLLEEASGSGERAVKKVVESPPPSKAAMDEYDKVARESQRKAVENIDASMTKQDITAKRDALKTAREIVDSSDEFADWTEIIEQGGLNLEIAHMTSDKETIKSLMLKRPTLFRKGGKVMPDQFAMDKGFDTPDELFQSWNNRASRKDAIEQMSDDLYYQYQAEIEAGQDLMGVGERYRQFLDETVEEINKGLSSKKPKKTLDEIYEIVKTKQRPGDETAADKLKTARTFFKKEVIDKFKSGSVGDILKKSGSGDKVSDANIASRFFKPGATGGETAQEFINAVGTNPNAREALENYIQQDLLSSATNPVTGEITDRKLKSWLHKYRPALKKLGLEDKFKSVETARESLDDALEMKTAFDKSVASKILDNDIDEAVKKVFEGGKLNKKARALMNKVKHDPKAVSGLQNAMIDHIIDSSQTTAVDAFGEKIISMAGVDKTFRKLRPAINIVFKDSPNKLKALDTYRSALRIMQRGKTSPLGGGSDTAENIIAAMASKSGLAHGKIATIAKAVIKPLLDMGDAHVNLLLNRAAFDPEFAYTLMQAAKGAPVDMIERKLKGHLFSLGIKAYDNYPNKSENEK